MLQCVDTNELLYCTVNDNVGLKLSVQPEQKLCRSGDARVLEGHSFIVGAAVSIGGRDIKPGINVYRFANRIPLLFEVWCKPQCCKHLGACLSATLPLVPCL